MGITIVRSPSADVLGSASGPPPSGIASVYASKCTQLWLALRQQGAVVLQLEDSPDSVGWAPLEAALGACQAFFDSPEPVKHAASSNVQGEGFLQREGKELLAFRPSGAHGSAAGREALRGRRRLEAACHSLDILGRSVLRDVCRSKELGVHPGELGRLLEDGAALRAGPSASVLRASSYAADAPPTALAFAPHHDRGVLTLVASNQRTWLQVRLPHGVHDSAEGRDDGCEWVDVPLGPGRVAVLAGFSLSYALGGLLQPVLHRVAPGASRRLSLAYELCFRPGARIDPQAIMLEAASKAQGPMGRPLYVSQLMDLFNATHPVSINGVPRGAAVATQNTAAAADAAVLAAATAAGTAAVAAPVTAVTAAATAAVAAPSAVGTAAAAAANAAGTVAVTAGAAAAVAAAAAAATATDAAGEPGQAAEGNNANRQGAQAEGARAPACGSAAPQPQTQPQPQIPAAGGRMTRRSTAAAAAATAPAVNGANAESSPAAEGSRLQGTREVDGAAQAAGEAAPQGPDPVEEPGRRVTRSSAAAAAAAAAAGAAAATAGKTSSRPEGARGLEGTNAAAGSGAAGATAPVHLAHAPPQPGGELPKRRECVGGMDGEEQAGDAEEHTAKRARLAGAEAEAAVENGPQQQQQQQPLNPIGIITIIVLGDDGSQVAFKVKVSTRLGQVFRAYARLKGVCEDSLRYVFDGARASASYSVSEAGLEDGDVMEAVIEQVGS